MFLRRKSKKEGRSESTPAAVTAAATAGGAGKSAARDSAERDLFGSYFGIPVECMGDFDDAYRRNLRRQPACIDSIRYRRGQPYKVYMKSSFPHLRILVANFAVGSTTHIKKGFRMKDMYFVRRALLNLLVKPIEDSSPELMDMGTAAPSEQPQLAPHPEEDESVSEMGGEGELQTPSKFILEDDSGSDLTATIRRELATYQVQQLQSVGYYTPNNGGYSLPPGLLDLAAWLEGQFQARIQTARDMEAAGVVTFDVLDLMYKSGSYIYGSTEDTGSSFVGMRVIKTDYRQFRSDYGTSRSFRVDAQFLCATGEGTFIYVPYGFTVSDFVMRRPRESMDWLPMPQDIREHLESRGRRYVELANGNHFMAYSCSGFSIHRFSSTSTAQVVSRSAFLRANGRVMIDNSTAARLGHFPCASTSSWGLSGAVVQHLRQAQSAAQNALATAHNPAMYHQNHSTMPISKIPRSFLCLTYPAVAGFSFTSKAWGHCLVDALSDIKFNERAFDQLVMAPSRKALIRALVVHTNDLFSDIIQGKGSSTVFLLHGPPGSGKTLSAESIAESLHKPLYSVTMGELGVTPESLEERIQEVLQLASLWGCLVLIDEADIVVERRNTKDLKRNALVGILLRQLEYFNGVLFLTSNRVSVFDEAVHSRVTIALKYKALSRRSRLEVWRVLLDAAGVPDIDPTELSLHKMNGRQIKNAIRLGEALARAHGEALTVKHLQHTISVSKEFLDLLHQTNADEADPNAELEVSDDEDPVSMAFAPSCSSSPQDEDQTLPKRPSSALSNNNKS